MTIRHRGIVCAECGAPLEERQVSGQWRTTCVKDNAHRGHVTKRAWQARPRRTMQQAIEVAMAEEILANLPAEFRAAILTDEGEKLCPSKD